FETGQGFAQLRPFGTDSVPYLNLRPASPGDSGGQCHVTPIAGCSWIRNAYRQRYTGSVSGGVSGAAGFRYFLSGTSEDNDGVLPLDNEKKFSTRGNFTFNLFDNVRVDWNTSYANTDLSNTPAGNNAHGLVLNVYRQERNYRNSGDPRVIDSLLNQSITSGIKRLITGGTVTYTPLPLFSNRFTVGYDLAQQENRNLRPFGFVAAPQRIGRGPAAAAVSQGQRVVRDLGRAVLARESGRGEAPRRPRVVGTSSGGVRRRAELDRGHLERSVGLRTRKRG